MLPNEISLSLDNPGEERVVTKSIGIYTGTLGLEGKS